MPARKPKQQGLPPIAVRLEKKFEAPEHPDRDWPFFGHGFLIKKAFRILYPKWVGWRGSCNTQVLSVFDFFEGDNINFRILSPSKKPKSGQNNPETTNPECCNYLWI